MLKIVKAVTNCKDCPQRAYASGGRYECRDMDDAPLPDNANIPQWCPLQDHPGKLAAVATEKARNTLVVLKTMRDALAKGGGTVEWTKQVIDQAVADLERL